MDSKAVEQNLKILTSKKSGQLRSKNHKTLEESANFLDLDYAQYYRLLPAAPSRRPMPRNCWSGSASWTTSPAKSC
jgi:hypothetical protein